MIQNEQNTAISRHFIKPAEYTRGKSGAIFSADVWISGGIIRLLFITKPGAYIRSFRF